MTARRRADRFGILLPTLIGSLILVVPGCRSDAPEVVVYTALDEDFSRSIFADFTDETGVQVRPKFDTESKKSLGLTEAIRAEKARPRCDLFWNNEILNTLRLEREGLLRVYRPVAADPFPETAKSKDGTWHGFAARARVLIVNAKLVSAEESPDSVEDLADPKWKDRGGCGLALPLYGTTASHAAALFSEWGDTRATRFFRDVKTNARVLSGNKQVALSVSAGRIAWGWTDTDDALIEIDKGMPVRIVYPDQGEQQMGTLFIPNTLAIIKGSPHQEHAERLVDYLLSAQVEAKLARGPSAQIPLNPQVEVPLRTESPATIRAMDVDWYAALETWDSARKFLTETFAVAE